MAEVDITKLEQAPRKDLHVFFVLDTSGSMSGSKISALNNGMYEAIEALKVEAKKNGDAHLKAAVLEFNSGCKWVTYNGPEDMEKDFEFEDLTCGGLTDIGAALRELNSKLSTHEYLQSMMGALMPVIIFMTDGQATDNWEKDLEEIRKNRWFKRATKIGFAVGDDADVAMIASVVGNSEAVIKTNDLDLFKRLIKFVAVTSSMLVSQSTNSEEAPSGETVVKMAEKQGDLPSTAVETLDPKDYNPEPISQPDPPEQMWDSDEDW